MSAADEAVPCLELDRITDFYVDGTHKIEILGSNVRMIYFRWRQIGGIWQRVAAEFAKVCPIKSLSIPLDNLPNIIVEERKDIRLHS